MREASRFVPFCLTLLRCTVGLFVSTAILADVYRENFHILGTVLGK